MRRTANGWEPDESLVDERWLAVNVAGKGLVVLVGVLACRHRQCLQTCACDVPEHSNLGRDRWACIVSGPNEAVIPQTVEALGEFD